MTQEQLHKLLSAQKLTASTIHSISKEVIDIIEHALIGDEEAFEKLKLINAKEYEVLDTFFKVSSLLMKILPLEHRIMGTTIIKNLDEMLQREEYENHITKTDINIMKGYIKSHAKTTN